MTKIDFNVIIDKLHCYIKADGSVNLKMEGHVTDTGNRSQYGKTYCSCTNYEIMTNLNVSLEESANYLIQLFYNTGKRYSCTRTKIGKLLSIVAFLYARNNQKLFNEDIYKYDDCGTAINELKAHIDRDVYNQIEYQDDEQEYQEMIDNSFGLDDVAEKHLICCSLPEDVRTNIETIFRRFGSFSPYNLGQCICPIVNCGGVTTDSGIIDLSKLFALKRENFNTQEYPLTLVDYLFD